jgi:hypothetical protein
MYKDFKYLYAFVFMQVCLPKKKKTNSSPLTKDHGSAPVVDVFVQ